MAIVKLAKKHTGMKVSAQGLFNNIQPQPIKSSALEMLENLKEMAERYYSGEIEVVDEFLQLYCLDEKRPK